MQNALAHQRVAPLTERCAATSCLSHAQTHARSHACTHAYASQQVLYLAPLIASVFPAIPNLHPLLFLQRSCTLARRPTTSRRRPHPPTKKNNLLQSPPPSLFISPSSVVKHSFSISLLLSLCQLIAQYFCAPPRSPPPPTQPRHNPSPPQPPPTTSTTTRSELLPVTRGPRVFAGDQSSSSQCCRSFGSRQTGGKAGVRARAHTHASNEYTKQTANANFYI